ncbi:putative RNA interference and gene silencing protein [Microdochium trichocladiopsis]|uniref:RNA interference and gene silencing protein n=1 Tax=Microdochium trichocladiopsis TaxID=1682393 RepID=A0A9P9BLU1_9PEZI|nr:putative RNA interference and gene silencing protein [Microdochium trichocladiopsis]KAH7025257.1 putative RNA interference and gene silencing protein [Microdochium trichocladiopsis]
MSAPGRGGSFRGGGGGRGPRRGGFGGDSSRGRSARGGFQGRGRGGVTVSVFSYTEDALLAATKGGLSLAGLKLREGFPCRPGFGTKGTPVTLWANYFEMCPPPKVMFYRYDIAVSPAVAGRKLSQVVRLLLESEELMEFRLDVATDFKSTLVSRQKLPADETVAKIQYRSEDEDEPRQNATQYEVRLLYTNTLSVSHLIEYLTSTNISARFNDAQSLVQAFNIFLNHHSKLTGNLATIGASKKFSLADNADKWDLGTGLTAIRGFFSSVRVATCRLLVNVNVSHGAFYEAGPLDKIMFMYYSAHQRSKYKLNNFLAKLKVGPTHLPERKNKKGEIVRKVKTIVGLANTNDGHGLQHPPRVKEFGAGPKDVEFWLEGGGGGQPASSPGAGSQEEGKKKKKKWKQAGPSDKPSSTSSSGGYISVYEFFWTKYNWQTNPMIPIINVGTRDTPSYLPPEVCVVVPGQNSNSKLNPAQTQQMIQFAVRSPWENAASIVRDGFQTVGLSSQANVLLDRFGVSVPPQLITVSGRVLNEPKVLYKEGKPAPVRSGSWNMVNVKLNTTGTMTNWSYLLISIPDRRDAFDQAGLIAMLVKFQEALRKTGMVVAPPALGRRLVLRDQDDPELDNSLHLLFIILPDTTPLYNRIKHCGDVKYGIQTICVVGHKIAKEKGQDQYFANVALKLNLKLRGNNQLLDKPRLGIINENKTMVVGIDVTHPSPGSSSRAPSIAGMVASVDRWLGQWPAVLRVQAGARQEMVTDLSDMLKSRLQLWKTKGHHQSLPENILVYRDGVSEGQYDKVIDEELPRLRKACTEVYPTSDQKKDLPHFTIVIVGKRHHTRFYPTKEANADRSGNPKPGTIVDRGVTEARNWDFFLQAHAAIQGTARPGHYVVVLDEIFRARYAKTLPPDCSNVADVLEDLTQSLCYVYGRTTKPVSLCTPAYYADIVCERARCYLSGVFDTPTQSAEPSLAGSQTEGLQVGNEDVRIHEKLKDTMFYI